MKRRIIDQAFKWFRGRPGFVIQHNRVFAHCSLKMVPWPMTKRNHLKFCSNYLDYGSNADHIVAARDRSISLRHKYLTCVWLITEWGKICRLPSVVNQVILYVIPRYVNKYLWQRFFKSRPPKNSKPTMAQVSNEV